MKFNAGESVICINDDFSWARRNYRPYKLTYPVRGQCYVIRGYVIGGKKPAVVLQSISNPRVPYNDGIWREAGFWDERFERAPDISELRKIAEEVSRSAPLVAEKEDA